MAILYECHNKNCPLGARGEPGRFTNGTSEALAESMGFTDVKLRSPENETGLVYGDGICPSCGVLGKKVGEHKSIDGHDPYAELHNAINAKVQEILFDAKEADEEPEIFDTRKVLADAVDILENNDAISKPETAVAHAIQAAEGKG